MKRNRIKNALIALFGGVLFGALTIFACGCEGLITSEDTGGGSTSIEEEVDESLTLNKTETSLLIGGYEKLKASYYDDEKVIAWTSSDSLVASVSATGMVTGVSVGTARIMARVDGKVATCTVTVGMGEFVPTLQMENFREDSVSIASVDTVNLQSVILFNGKRYEDARFTYELSDSSMGEIVGGKFTPAKKGVVEITISATWRGMDFQTVASLKKTFTVRVEKDITFTVNGNEPQDIELYTLSRWGGKSFKNTATFLPKAYINGVETECLVACLGAEDVVTVEEREIVAGKKGEVTLKLSCVDGEREYSARFKVKVIRPVADSGQTFTGISLVDGNIDAEKLFGDGAVLVDAYQGNTPLSVRDNCILGMKSERNGLTTTKVTVYTQEAGYTVTLKGYTKILRTAADFKVFEVKANSPFYDEGTDTVKIDGYFVLANDIQEKETITHDSTYVTYQDKATYQYPNGFYGVLEGNGHSVTYRSGQYGFFGNLVQTAIVRNIAFVDISVDATCSYESMKGAAPVIANKISARYGANGSMENVYIGVKSGYQIGLVEDRPAWFDIRNVVIEYGEEVQESTRGARGSLFCGDNYRSDRKDNISEDLRNIFIVCKKGTPVEFHWGSQYRGYAANQTVEPTFTGEAYHFSSIYQTATRAEMVQTIKQYGCRLSDFNSAYWDCSSGMPVWKGWLGTFAEAKE